MAGEDLLRRCNCSLAEMGQLRQGLKDDIRSVSEGCIIRCDSKFIDRPLFTKGKLCVLHILRMGTEKKTYKVVRKMLGQNLNATYSIISRLFLKG